MQRVAAAKWALEAGRSEQALDIITETIEIAHELVSELLRDDQETSGVHARTARLLAR